MDIDSLLEAASSGHQWNCNLNKKELKKNLRRRVGNQENKIKGENEQREVKKD